MAGGMGSMNGTMNSIQSAVANAGNAAMMASMYDQVRGKKLERFGSADVLEKVLQSLNSCKLYS